MVEALEIIAADPSPAPAAKGFNIVLQRTGLRPAAEYGNFFQTSGRWWS
jgi:hypothetical protein